MTSDAVVSDVYVHVRHPDGATDLAARYRHVQPPGARSYGEFAYVGSWLANRSGRAFALDPANLPLSPGPVVVQRRGLLPGVLADATPDRWGRRLIEETHPRANRMRASDWLLATGEDRVGCLAFSKETTPPKRHADPATTVDLATIADGFERLLRGESPGGLAERLWKAGISMGGARPKAVIEHQGALWIAKFQRRDDEYDQCSSEHATMRLAGECGIRVAETKVLDVGPRKVVLVRRFDRTEGDHEPSCHYLSGLSALGHDETMDEGSYPDLAAFLRRHGTSQIADRRELFRRMVFNVLCGNRDDHLKNHGFVRLPDRTWRLSAAFDIVPQPDMHDTQAIGLGIMGGLSSKANYMSMLPAFDLDPPAAEAIVADLTATMGPWRRKFAAWGVPDETIRRLGRAFSKTLADDDPSPDDARLRQP